MNKNLIYPLFAFVIFGITSIQAATVTMVGNGASGGAIFVTSSFGNIDLGTRLRVGTFGDSTLLNSTIAAFNAGTASYAATLSALNSNFADLGTNVTNYGNASQVGTGVSSSQVVFNATASLAINGAVAATYNVFTGSIQNVTYSSSIGASKNLYIWAAFNNEIGIVRNVDGTGTTAWVTPASDLSGVTLNLSGINSQSEVLLGAYTDYATGSDLIRLQAAIPEPSTGALMMIGGVGLVALRRLRKV
jgi:hypothetical protein